MGADIIEHAAGAFSRAVFIKGGSGNPLAYKATVTTYTDTTHFASTDVSGHEDDYFGGPNNGWYIYVARDDGGAGALPQGEYAAISDYVSATGAFTHPAFTTPLAVGDEVLIVHEWVRSAGVGDATAANQTTILADTAKIKNATYATDGAIVADGGNTTTTFKTNLTNATSDFYEDLEIVFTSGTNDTIPRRISAYNGATKFVTVDTALPNIPAGADTIQIVSRVAVVGGGGGTATEAKQDLMLADVGNASAATLTSIYGILGDPSASLAATILDGIDARVNNSTLHALLGVPDVAGKPLYTCLVTDRLDHATHGLSAIQTDVGRNVSMMEFWGDVDDLLTLTTATTNVDLPNIVVADIPAGATIVRVVGMIRMRALNNTNAAVNAINGANTIRVKKSTGAWAVDDVDLINIPDNILSTAASTKEGGLLIYGSPDAASEVDANATYNLRFNGNIFVDGNNLDLIDVVAGLKVYFVA